MAANGLKGVLVCTWNDPRGDLPDMIEEVLTLGRRLSTTLGSELTWLHLGPAAKGLGAMAARYGVAGIDRIEDPKLASFQADPLVAALAQHFEQTSPQVVLFGQTFDARLVAPRLAGRVNVGIAMNAVGIELADQRRLQVTASAYGGDTRVVYELSGETAAIVAVSANSVQPEPTDDSAAPPAERTVSVDLGGVEERVRVISRETSEGPRLEDAQIIVAGGRGLQEPENFKLIEELADALGGMAAASRPIVDEKWTDPSRQIGLTGKISRPALYLAAGISGASQHMVGCSAAKTIVAINTDPDAAIFQHARYGIVGNCLEILPELIRIVKG